MTFKPKDAFSFQKLRSKLETAEEGEAWPHWGDDVKLKFVEDFIMCGNAEEAVIMTGLDPSLCADMVGRLFKDPFTLRLIRARINEFDSDKNSDRKRILHKLNQIINGGRSQDKDVLAAINIYTKMQGIAGADEVKNIPADNVDYAQMSIEELKILEQASAIQAKHTRN